ncbi:MAG: hypothetical protein ACRC5C_10180 [Bacilli bacterium]
MHRCFAFDHRLGIHRPNLDEMWERYPFDEQVDILTTWELIRGAIPDRIADLENQIRDLQSSLDCEEDFETSCTLNSRIAELASTINELWLWFRMDEQISKSHF